MPFQWKIAIDVNTQGVSPQVVFDPPDNVNTQGVSPRVVFDPPDLQAKVLDQIFWANNDPSEAHWPGLLKDDGSIDETFFMPNQIAPNGDVSATFSTTAPATFKYACSLHPDEQGTITVT